MYIRLSWFSSSYRDALNINPVSFATDPYHANTWALPVPYKVKGGDEVDFGQARDSEL